MLVSILPSMITIIIVLQGNRGGYVVGKKPSWQWLIDWCWDRNNGDEKWTKVHTTVHRALSTISTMLLSVLDTLRKTNRCIMSVCMQSESCPLLRNCILRNCITNTNPFGRLHYLIEAETAHSEAIWDVARGYSCSQQICVQYYCEHYRHATAPPSAWHGVRATIFSGLD